MNLNTAQPLAKRWIIHPRLPNEVDQELVGLPPILRQLLYNRGIQSKPAAEGYIHAQPPAGSAPENLLGLPQAVDRIRFAIDHQEKIAVYGDYDVDGVTATALLTQVLKHEQADVKSYIPNRFDEGYGLNKDALASLFQAGVRLVITVDCGVRSHLEAEYARSIGLDLIITDHHQPLINLPDARAVINPKQSGDNYPDKGLVGVGLAYKLAAGLVGETSHLLDEQFDLVALGTVADLAPLIGENRFLVKKGLTHLRQPVRQGLYSLMVAANINPATINARQIGFALAPRLNAAGRLDSALAALDLLTTQDLSRSGHLAQQLDDQNRERQKITIEIQLQAEKLAFEQDPNAFILFAAHPDFNAGVIGLAASRLVDKYYRPAIVAQQGKEFTRASCRSIPEFHITNALDECSELFEHHGGHSAAAGFTIRNEHLPVLVERLKSIAERDLAGEELLPKLQIDMEIPLYGLRPEILNYQDALEPTGQLNPSAIFSSRDLQIMRAWSLGKDGAHLKMTVSDGRITFTAIAFRQGHLLNNLPTRIDLAYQFELNEFNGRTDLQLLVLDFKPADSLP